MTQKAHRIIVILNIIAGLLLFVALVIIGTKIYYGQIIPAAQGIGSLGLLPIFGFSIIAGALSFFAPCPVSVFPAYVGLFLAEEGQKKYSLSRALRFGFTAAFAILLFYAALGGVLSLVGTAAARYVLIAKPYIILLIALLGILLLFNVRLPTGLLDRTSQLLRTGVRTSSSELLQSFLYGLLYAVGGAACFLPILLTIGLTPILTGNTLAGFLAFVGYGGALGLMLVFATVLIEQGRTTILRAVIGRAALLKRFAGALLLLAALAMGVFYMITGM